MKTSRIVILAAFGVVFAQPARSACNVVQSGLTSHTETDCASAADVTVLQGIAVTHSGQIGALQGSDTAQNTTLGTHTTQIGALQASDSAQNTTIGTHTGQIATHTSQIGALQTNDATQDATLATHTTQIADGVAHDVIQDTRLDGHDVAIGSLETLAAQQGATINAHSALLSQHTARLDEQEKGIAIAMALPDAWLGDHDKFAIAGNIGGFGGETAIGFAGIGRINQTWSLNGKVGADTEFKEFGWTVGARAGW